jgi:anti-anti-sigma regulatory factor
MSPFRECRVVQVDPTPVPGCLYVVTEGHLDAGPSLAAWKERVEKLIADGARWIIFDTRQIQSYVDLGHGTLVYLSDKLQQAGGGAILLAMNARERMVFGMLKIEGFFRFAETLEEALAIARGDTA